MEFVVYAFIGLLVIAFFVFLWFAAKTWRWFDLTLLTFALFASIAVLPLASGVLRVRADWERVRTDLQKRLAKASDQITAIKRGDGANGLGLSDLQFELTTFKTDAGRVWRGLQMGGVQLGTPSTVSSITLNAQAPAAAAVPDPNAAAAAPDPNAAAAGAPDPNANPNANAAAGPVLGLDIQTVVYAFAEEDFNGLRVPRFYLGDFVVTASANNQIGLQSLLPLHPRAANALTGGQVTTCTLYELAPVDGHKIFTAPESKEDVSAIFGRVDDQLVQELFKDRVPQKVLDAYLQDGKQFRPDDPPSAKWTRVNFKVKTEIPVDSQEARNASDGGYFDVNGQSVDSRLKRGEGGAVVMDPADVKANQAVFLDEAAQAYITQGAAELIDSYFVRPLNDYSYLLRSMKIEIDDLAESEVVINRDLEILNAAIAKTVKLQQTEQDMKDKLERESQITRKERDAVKAYYEKIDAELKELRGQMVAMYQQNLELAKQLAAVQQKVLTNSNQAVR